MPRRPRKYDQYSQRVFQLAREGRSLSQIHHGLDREVSVPTISRWLAAEGIPTQRSRGDLGGGKPRHPKRGDAEEALGRGESPRSISDRLGIPMATIHRWRQESGVCRCGGKASPVSTYCSPECESTYSKRQKDPEFQVTFNCEMCGEEVTRYRKYGNGANKFCSNTCAMRHTKTVRHYVVRDSDMVLDSGWEMLLAGLAIFLGIPIERFDRTGSVEWAEGRTYGPDFHLPSLGVWVEVKGQEDPEDQARWAAFREQVGPLAVVDRDSLDALRPLDRDGVLERLTSLATGV